MRVWAVLILSGLVLAGCTSPPKSPREAPQPEDFTEPITPLPEDSDETTQPTQRPPRTSSPPSTTRPAPSEGPGTGPPDPDGPPPHARADVVALRDAILAGGEVTVQAYHVGHIFSDGYVGLGSWWGDPSMFTLALQLSPILTPETFFEVDHTPVERPFVEVYEGTVAGQPDQPVRLTLTWEWARGSVRVGDEVYLVRMHYANNVPGADVEDLGRLGLPGFQPQARTYDDEPGQCPGGLESWAPITVTPVFGQEPNAMPKKTARLIMDGDGKFMETTGEHAFAVLVALAAETEAVYDYEVGIRHTLLGVHLTTEPYADPDVTDPLDPLALSWDGRHMDRDVVHLVTGHDSSYARANCIGAVGHPNGAYSFTPYPWELDDPALHTNVMAHELGHLYSAHHHYGNHVEAALATIMIQGYTPGAQPVFSSLEKAVIRGWADRNL